MESLLATCPPSDCIQINPLLLPFRNDYFTLTNDAQGGGYSKAVFSSQIDPLTKEVTPCFNMANQPFAGLQIVPPLLLQYNSTSYQVTLTLDVPGTSNSGIPSMAAVTPYKLVTTFVTSSGTYTAPIFVQATFSSSSYIDTWGFLATGPLNSFSLHPAKNACVNAAGTSFWCIDSKSSVQRDVKTNLAIIASPPIPLLVSNTPKSSSSATLNLLLPSIRLNIACWNALALKEAQRTRPQSRRKKSTPRSWKTRGL